MDNINLITIIFFAIFFVPIVIAFIKGLEIDNMVQSIDSFIETIEFMISLYMATFITRKVFFEYDNSFFQTINNAIPRIIKEVLYGRDVLTYVIFIPILLVTIMIIFRILTIPIYTLVVNLVNKRLAAKLERSNHLTGRLLNVICTIPKSVLMVMLLGFALNFANYYYTNPNISKLLNTSKAYQVVYNYSIEPALNSNIAKNMPVIINNSFSNSKAFIPLQYDEHRVLLQQSRTKITVTEYFNGVTLDEAIESSKEIDEKAKEIVEDASTDIEKAYLIYQWIVDNIEYDNEKAIEIGRSSYGMSSGSIAAFETRKGICFDFASLYISMCRAVDIPVRLITGLGYSGVSWGDHAWNQVFSREEDRWIDVDTTFGYAGNYFDKKDFYVDHKFPEIQGQW